MLAGITAGAPNCVSSVLGEYFDRELDQSVFEAHGEATARGAQSVVSGT